jgi:lipopolysaccharide transport system permease protein
MASQAESRQQIVIKPTHGWSALKLRELWEYRDLLYFMVWRDLKGRYQQMALGPLWIVIQPLMSMFLYTLIFGVIAKLPSENQPYAVFTYTALLPWGFFTDAVGAGSSSLIEGKTLISKIYFPRLILPLARVLSSLVDLSISFLILLGMMVYYGIRPTWGILFVPIFLLIAAMTGLGVGLWFAGIVVRYRDFGQVAGYLVRIWMYLTPVVYSVTIVPPRWLTLYRLNPMTGVVEGFRWALLGTSRPPDWTLVLSAVLMVPILVGGLYVFKRSERNIVDIA